MVRRLNYYRFYLRICAYLLPLFAYLIAGWLRFQTFIFKSGATYHGADYRIFCLLTTVIWIVAADRNKISTIDRLFRERTGFRAALAACSVTAAVDLVVLFFIRGVDISRGFFGLAAVILLVLTMFMRAAFRIVLSARVSDRNPIRVLMVGTDRFARRSAIRLRSTPFACCRMVGYVQLPGQSINVGDAPIYTSTDMGKLNNRAFDDIVIAVPAARFVEVTRLIGSLQRLCRPIRAVVDMGGNVIIHEKLFQFGPLQMLDLETAPTESLQYLLFKRSFDIVFSACALAVSSPVIALIALLVKLTSSGPIVFTQERVGLNGQVFNMYKFRTMRVAPEKESNVTWTRQNDPRRTALGAFLRATSLDELPQFYNVLKGDMSVVGPRPERPHFVKKFLKDFAQYNNRHQLRVGITGWAQVNGWRGDTSIKKRIEHDLYYLQNWSLTFDLRIIFMTLWSGLVNRSAY